MSRTNENKLKMKDIATIGIFSALLFVVTMVAGALMGISMVLNMYSVAVVAVLSAPLYMLIMAKVHKKGAVLLTFAIVGILWGLFGGIFVLIWMLGFGVVGEVLASKSKYQNYKMLTVSFGLYSVGYYLGAIAPLYYYPAFWYGFDRPKETVDEDKLQQSIDHLTKGKTLIVIAHRLSTIMYADKILVLEDGAISAEGTHEQLLSSSQTYLDMWKAHISAMDWSMNKEAEILC